MESVDIPPDRVRDPAELRQPGVNAGRDPARTPMAWDASANAGFSGAEPWLPLHSDWPERNVEAQDGGPGSMLNLVKRLLGLRRAHPALATGRIALLETVGGVLAYERSSGGKRIVVALNLDNTPQVFSPPSGTPLLSTLDDAISHGMLRPDEGVIFA